jgi:hypothetical protein
MEDHKVDLPHIVVLCILIGFVPTHGRNAPVLDAFGSAPRPLPTLMPTPTLAIPQAPPTVVPLGGPSAPASVVIEQNDGAVYITNSTTTVDVDICVGFCNR